MSELALQLIAKAKKEKAKVLDLGKCGLTRLPDELFELEWLEKLYVCNAYWDWEKGNIIESKNSGSSNKLNSIPPQINKLINLQVLYIGDDFFETWKISNITAFKDLTQLTTLYLTNNQINDITANINDSLFRERCTQFNFNLLKMRTPISNGSRLSRCKVENDCQIELAG